MARIALAALLFAFVRPAWSDETQPYRRLASFSGPRNEAVMVVDNGKLLLVGGWGGNVSQPRALRSAATYDPKKDVWTQEESMPSARWAFAGGIVKGRFFAAGGLAGPGDLSTAMESYDPASGAWTRHSAIPFTRNLDGGAVVDGKLYLAGGNNRGFCVNRVDVYDEESDAWAEAPPMPTAVCGAATVAYDGRIYVLGGNDSSGANMYATVQIFDPGSGTWTEGTPMPTARRYLSAAVVDGEIYAVGGTVKDGFSRAVESYDPVSGQWTVHSNLPVPRSLVAAAGLDGKLYLAGGCSQFCDPLSDLLEYDPKLDGASRKTGSARPVFAYRRPEAPLRAIQRYEPARPVQSDVDGVASRGNTRPDDYALVVGIDGYRGLPHAAYGEGDASAFAAYAQRVLGVPAENVILLTGQKATRTDLAKYVEEWLPRNVTKDSRVYFYYSGHGAPDPAKGTAYLLPWDGDPEFLESSAYPLARLYARLEALPAKDVIVMLDSCFSGAGAGGRSLIAKNLRPLVNVAATPRHGRRISILTASAGDEVAGSSDVMKHGLFTYYLLKGLRGEADVERTGHVDLDELHAYVERNVLRAAHRENREQHPKLETSEPNLRVY